MKTKLECVVFPKGLLQDERLSASLNLEYADLFIIDYTYLLAPVDSTLLLKRKTELVDIVGLIISLATCFQS